MVVGISPNLARAFSTTITNMEIFNNPGHRISHHLTPRAKIRLLAVRQLASRYLWARHNESTGVYLVADSICCCSKRAELASHFTFTILQQDIY